MRLCRRRGAALRLMFSQEIRPGDAAMADRKMSVSSRLKTTGDGDWINGIEQPSLKKDVSYFVDVSICVV